MRTDSSIVNQYGLTMGVLIAELSGRCPTWLDEEAWRHTVPPWLRSGCTGYEHCLSPDSAWVVDSWIGLMVSSVLGKLGASVMACDLYVEGVK